MRSEPEPLKKVAYDVDQASFASGIGRSELYKAMRAQELVTCKVGKRRLILPEDLEAWLRSKRVVPAA